MEVLDMTIEKFLDEVERPVPTPACGCVSGLCGALGAALVSMVANLTAGRTAYAAVDQKMNKILETARTIRREFKRLANDDLVVYTEYVAARRMPSSSIEERAVRNEALGKRSQLIVTVPVEMAEQSVVLGALALDVLENGNRNVCMDAAAAVKLAHTSARIAVDNALFNLMSVDDERFRKKSRTRLETAMKDIEAILATSEKIIEGMIER